MPTLSHVTFWAETYDQFSQRWGEIDRIMDELNVEQVLIEHMPPSRRHQVDRLHHLMRRIGELFEELEVAAMVELAELDDEPEVPGTISGEARGRQIRTAPAALWSLPENANRTFRGPGDMQKVWRS